MKCKTKTPNQDERTQTSANGRKMIKSTCAVCGAKKSQFAKSSSSSSSSSGGAILTTLGAVSSAYKAFNEATAPYQQKAQNRIDARMAKWDAEDAKGRGISTPISVPAILNKLTPNEQDALALALGISCLNDDVSGSGAWDDFLNWTRGGRGKTTKTDAEVWDTFRNNFTYGFNAENVPQTTEYLQRLATR